MISDRKQLTINFYRELFFKDQSVTKDSESLLAERWWGIGAKYSSPLNEFNIREAIGIAKMSEEEKNLRDELSQMQAKQIQTELLSELDVYIEIDKKKEFPGFKSAKKLFANYRGSETDTTETKNDSELRGLFWPWQTDSVQMYNQAKKIIFSIKNYDTAILALQQLKALINPKMSRRLSQRLVKAHEILRKHLDDLSDFVVREFAAWVHHQIKSHYAKLYASVETYFQAYTKYEPITGDYPIQSEAGYYDTKTSRVHDIFYITIPWGKEDVAFIASLEQRMRVEARQVVAEILQSCRARAGLLPELSTSPVSESTEVSPEIEKKLETTTEIEGVFNPHPVLIDPSAPEQPGEIEENEEQPGLPFFARAPRKEIEGLEEVEGRPAVRRIAYA